MTSSHTDDMYAGMSREGKRVMKDAEIREAKRAATEAKNILMRLESRLSDTECTVEANKLGRIIARLEVWQNS